MTKHIIFQDSFLISGIMCHQNCGGTIQNALGCLDDLKRRRLLPNDAQLSIDAEPQALGVHRLFIVIESESQTGCLQRDAHSQLVEQFKLNIEAVGYDVITGPDDSNQDAFKTINWVNIFINLVAIVSIIVLSVVFPPSIPLSIGLTVICFLATAFTARRYFIEFFRNLRHRNVFNMPTAITLAWVLSLTHTLYHLIGMPIVMHFSMTFMNFIMPVMLVTIVNVMDEIKRLVLDRSKKMHLKGMKALFPGMADDYPCYQFLANESLNVQDILEHAPIMSCNKNALKKDMLIQIKRGVCFPVDGIIIQGHTRIDASILTGEPQQSKQVGDVVPAGAINLGQDVIIQATENCYNSTVNRLLFRSNRAQETQGAAESERRFTYWYSGLIMSGIAVSLLTPFALGLFTVSLMLQNITGTLFAICPCTIAIAHQLPILLGLSRLNDKSILLRNDQVMNRLDDIHTVVFDKTGTLTTGNSRVHSSDDFSLALWQRIFLLEEQHGFEHPLAKAVCHYCKEKGFHSGMFTEVTDPVFDLDNRGLSAKVQGNRIHLGNEAYLKDSGVTLPDRSELINRNLEHGYTPIYVAEKGVYQGVIFIKHEVRPDIIDALSRLKREGKKLIMLTGDSRLSALGFNQQNGAIFDEAHIHAGKTPSDKEQFLDELMSQSDINPKGVWFVGDGLNDAPSARMVTEKGGVSCAITSDDKAVYFTDIALNGTLDYLFEHRNINRMLKKNIIQNQWLLAYGALAFLICIISFPMVGLGISPLIPVIIMVATTVFTLFNSYRVPCMVDTALDKKPSWLKQYIASDISIGLLVSGSALLLLSVLILTLATGHLALPALVFTGGVVAAVSSSCLLAAVVMLGGFMVLGAAYVFVDSRVVKKNSDVLSSLDSECNAESSRDACAGDVPHYATLGFGLYNVSTNRNSQGEEPLPNEYPVYRELSPGKP